MEEGCMQAGIRRCSDRRQDAVRQERELASWAMVSCSKCNKSSTRKLELTGRQDVEIMEWLTQDTAVTGMTAGCRGDDSGLVLR